MRTSRRVSGMGPPELRLLQDDHSTWHLRNNMHSHLGLAHVREPPREPPPAWRTKARHSIEAIHDRHCSDDSVPDEG